jgi:hypothetical protein
MSRVLMTHPESGGEYWATPDQVPHLQEADWQIAPGQNVDVEEWPAELRRFGGQDTVKMRHPEIEGDPITAALSQVPFYREKGWQIVDEDAATEAAQTGGLEDLTLDQLKEEARARDLPVSGTKAELVERLRGEPKQDESQDQAGDEPAQPSEEA